MALLATMKPDMAVCIVTILHFIVWAGKLFIMLILQKMRKKFEGPQDVISGQAYSTSTDCRKENTWYWTYYEWSYIHNNPNKQNKKPETIEKSAIHVNLKYMNVLEKSGNNLNDNYRYGYICNYPATKDIMERDRISLKPPVLKLTGICIFNYVIDLGEADLNPEEPV